MRVYIYSLTDPRDGEVRYIGRTNNPEERLKNHLKMRERERHTHRCRWISDVINNGYMPEMTVLAETDEHGWDELERYYVALYLEKGCRLTNHTLGGAGGYGRKMSADGRARISAAMASREPRRGWNHTPEAREKMSASLRGRTLSAETRAKIGESGRGRVPTEETRRKLSNANTGRKHSLEWNANFAASRRGKGHSEETKERLRQISKGQDPRLKPQYGADNNKTKLTLDDYEEIKRLRLEGCPGTRIGEMFGVSSTTVYNICKGRLVRRHPDVL